MRESDGLGSIGLLVEQHTASCHASIGLFLLSRAGTSYPLCQEDPEVPRPRQPKKAKQLKLETIPIARLELFEGGRIIELR